MAVVQVEEPAKTLATAPGHAKYRGHAPLSQSEMGPMSSPGMTGGYTANGDGTGPVQIGEKKEYYGG
jgi:hypothetical protein